MNYKELNTKEVKATFDGIEKTIKFISSNGTVICVYVNERSEFLLIEQFRPIFNANFLEFPGGSIENDEAIETAAKREFLEETSVPLDNLKLQLTIIPSIGISNEKIYIFSADTSKKYNFPQSIDKFKLKWVDRIEAKRLVDIGEIIDAKTIIGILTNQP